MHVLTKIFVVLVTLLAIMITPLVVVYAYNEGSYKAKYEQALAQSVAAKADLSSLTARSGIDASRSQAEIDRLNDGAAMIQRDLDNAEATARKLEAELASSLAFRGDLRSQMQTFATAVESGQRMTQSLITEVRDVRSRALDAERRRVELDEAYNEIQGQLEVEQATRRMLEEEVARLNNDRSASLELQRRYISVFGELPEQGGPATGVIADRDVDTTIVNVMRGAQNLAEINAGSRDGVREGWVFTVGSNGSFKGNLRIIRVDENRATGVIELEDFSRGSVNVNDRAYVRAGEG